MVTAKMSLKDSRAELLVVEGNAKPLLSRSTPESLGVLRINANYVAGEYEFSDRLVDKFPKLWDGISCVRGQQLQLHIDPSVPPIAAKYNRVPFHPREKVEKEIKKSLWMPTSLKG